MVRVYEPVPLLQVYSNPSPEVVAPQKLLFRSVPLKSEPDAQPHHRRARQLRTNEVESLATHYSVVRNIRRVAEDFGLSRSTVARILKAKGIRTSHSMTENQIDVAAKLYREGLSSGAIGQRLGFDNHTILKALRGRGVDIRAR